MAATDDDTAAATAAAECCCWVLFKPGACAAADDDDELATFFGFRARADEIGLDAGAPASLDGAAAAGGCDPLITIGAAIALTLVVVGGVERGLCVLGAALGGGVRVATVDGGVAVVVVVVVVCDEEEVGGADATASVDEA